MTSASFAFFSAFISTSTMSKCSFVASVTMLPMLSWWQSGYSPWPLSLLSWQLQLPSLCHIFANSTSLPYFCKFCNLAWGSSKAIIRLSASWICFLDIFIFCSVANLFASLPFSLCLSAYAFFDCSTFSCCPQPLFLVLSKLCNHGYSLICHLST